jgi:hypothetical protein
MILQGCNERVRTPARRMIDDIYCFTNEVVSG